MMKITFLLILVYCKGLPEFSSHCLSRECECAHEICEWAGAASCQRKSGLSSITDHPRALSLHQLSFSPLSSSLWLLSLDHYILLLLLLFLFFFFNLNHTETTQVKINYVLDVTHIKKVLVWGFLCWVCMFVVVPIWVSPTTKNVIARLILLAGVWTVATELDHQGKLHCGSLLLKPGLIHGKPLYFTL